MKVEHIFFEEGDRVKRLSDGIVYRVRQIFRTYLVLQRVDGSASRRVELSSITDPKRYQKIQSQ